ncbi:MAG: hypothetical protein ACRDB5_05005 [Cetobacterium sp.]
MWYYYICQRETPQTKEKNKDINNRIEKIVRSYENNRMPVMAKPFRWLKGVRKS